MWSDVIASLSWQTLAVLWLGAFFGGFASGAAGFAFGIVGASIWLHALDPLYTTVLIVTGGLAMQTGTIWPLRRQLEARRLVPALIAVLIGVPIGVWLLVHTNTGALKFAFGIFLTLYGIYALLAPRLPHLEAGTWADGVVGFISGVMGGIGGFSGVAPAIWAQVRGWPKDAGRAFYQPCIVVAHVATIITLGTVALDLKGLILFALALPLLVLGGWIGWSVYGRLDERRFRQMFAVLLIVSGLVIIL